MTLARYGCHVPPAEDMLLACADRCLSLSGSVSLRCNCLQIAPSEVAFRGLAVRMAIAYGKVSKARVHPMTMRVE